MPPNCIPPDRYRLRNRAVEIPKSVVLSSTLVLFDVGAIKPAPSRKPLCPEAPA